jgi:hypothetical protein
LGVNIILTYQKPGLTLVEILDFQLGMEQLGGVMTKTGDFGRNDFNPKIFVGEIDRILSDCL